MSMDAQKANWPGWETVRMIGSGGFGAVYEIKRDLFGDEEKAALKVISIPQNPGDVEEMYNDGYDEESITSTFRGYLKSIVAEYSMMRRLSDCPYIVTCDDVRYVQHDDGIGWDVYIKMELLTPVMKALPPQIPEEAAIKLARDLCAALVACGRHGIIHRDIKPQNIFISGSGDYKLGDFGIAKAAEKTMSGTRIGTYKYMAPEVYNNHPYGAQADIYSLGLVLYWMLNERRMPFLPLPPAKLTAGMDEKARLRRLSGEELPPPAHGSDALKRIVLKACAYDPARRYANAGEMLRDLEDADNVRSVPGVSGNAERAKTPSPVETSEPAWQSIDETVILSREDGILPRYDETVVLAYDNPAVQAFEETVCLFGTQPSPDVTWVPCREELTEEETMLIFSQGAPQPAPLSEAEQKARANEALKRMFQEMDADEAGHDPKHKRPIFAPRKTTPPVSARCYRHLCAGENHAAALLPDGSVSVYGDNSGGKCDTQGWQNMLYICCGDSYTLGLQANGTLRLAGALATDEDALLLRHWRNVIFVASSPFLIAGLNTNAQVLISGLPYSERRKIGGWKGITSVDVGNCHVVGLRSDGMVLSAGDNQFNQCGVGAWCSIVSVAAGGYHTIACKDNGRVLATGNNSCGQCATDTWRDIISVKAGRDFSLGLKKDGTVLAAGGSPAFREAIKRWSGIRMISAGNNYAVGYKADGTLCTAALTQPCGEAIAGLTSI